MGCLVILLFLVVAAVLGGPIGVALAGVLILAWLVVSSTLHVVLGVLRLAFRLLVDLLRLPLRAPDRP